MASTATFPISTAIANLVTNGFQATVSVSGNLGGISVSGTGTYAWSPAFSSTYENMPAFDATNVVNVTIGANGVSQPIFDVYHQYFSPNYLAMGQIDSDGTYYLVTSFSGWPSAAKVGDSGVLGAVTIYADSIKTTIIGYQQLSYTIEAYTVDTVILNLTTAETDTNGQVTNQHDRYRVTTAGQVTFVSSGGTFSDSSGTGNLLLTATSVWSVSPPLPVLNQAVAYQIDPAHSGHVAFGQPLTFPNSPTWSVHLGGVVSYPLIVGGKVFVTTAYTNSGTGAQLWALDEATGNIIWGPVNIAGTYNFSGHAYDNGKVFVVNSDGLLQSFDASTGVMGWSTQLPFQRLFEVPPTAVNGIVYASGSGSGGTLYAVDEATGKLLWTAPVENGNSIPAVSNDGVFVSYACEVYKFRPNDGAGLWQKNTGLCGGGNGWAPAYANGFLYVRDADYSPTGTIFESASGNKVATFNAGSIYALGPIPAIGGRTGFVLNGGTLQAFDLVTNNVLWSFVGDGNLVTAPIIIDQAVIVGSGSGNVYVVDTATGVQLWSGYAGASLTAVAEGQIAWPLTGISAGEGYLVVPAGNLLTAWQY